MPRAALFLLFALAGSAHAASAAEPPTGTGVVPADKASSREPVVPARPEVHADPAAAPPGEGQPLAGDGQPVADPGGTPAPAAAPRAAAPPPGTEPSVSTPSAAAPGGLGSGTTDAAPARPAEAGAAPAAGSAAPALPLPPSTAHLAVSGVLGRTVDGPDGQDIGRVVDVLVDGSGHPRAAVIDFGGFMGLGSRKIAVEWSAFSFPPGGSDAVLRIVLSPEQIKDTPEYAGPGKPVAVVGPGTPVPGPGP